MNADGRRWEFPDYRSICVYLRSSAVQIPDLRVFVSSWFYSPGSLTPHCGRLAEAALHHVVGVGGDRPVAPEPAHHLRHDRTAEFLAVPVHAPRVVDVIPLARERLRL
jgi:hypothetical protein